MIGLVLLNQNLKVLCDKRRYLKPWKFFFDPVKTSILGLCFEFIRNTAEFLKWFETELFCKPFSAETVPSFFFLICRKNMFSWSKQTQNFTKFSVLSVGKLFVYYYYIMLLLISQQAKSNWIVVTAPFAISIAPWLFLQHLEYFMGSI